MTDSITLRFQERKRLSQSIISQDPILEWLANTLRDKYGAKLLYIEGGSVKLGVCELGVPVGLYTIPQKKGKRK